MAMEFLGNISQKINTNTNPNTRETKFGTLDNPMALTVYYEGWKDKYDTYFGAFKISKLTDTFTLKFIGSFFIL
jgi:hypothetical protein